MTDDTLTLGSRDGLPDALRVLLADYPREGWEADPNFSALIRFWLDRHIMFRRILDTLTEDTRAALDDSSAPEAYAARLSKLGGMFVNQLHGHHMIEDTHYFPRLTKLDTRLTRGFEMLDRDHHALDGHLADFTNQANTTIRAHLSDDEKTDPTADMLTRVERMQGFLERHLTDEEDLIVPVLLKHAPPDLT